MKKSKKSEVTYNEKSRLLTIRGKLLKMVLNQSHRLKITPDQFCAKAFTDGLGTNWPAVHAAILKRREA